MKYCKQFSWLFCCCLLFCMLFSVPAKAAALTGYTVTQDIYYYRYENNALEEKHLDATFKPTDSTHEAGSSLVSNKVSYPSGGQLLYVEWEISNNGNVLYPKGGTTVTFKNAYFRLGFQPEDKSYTNYYTLKDNGEILLQVKNSSGQWKDVDTRVTLTPLSVGFYNISFYADLNYDVYGIRFMVTNTIPESTYKNLLSFHSGTDTYWCYWKFLFGEGPSGSVNNQYLNKTNLLSTLRDDERDEDDVYVPEVDSSPSSGPDLSETNSLLDNIAEEIHMGINNIQITIGDWLQPIKNGIDTIWGGITDGIGYMQQGFQDMQEGFTDLVENIADLPKQIKEGITSLFVPDNDTVMEYVQDFGSLFEQKFGALYQVTGLLTNFFSSLDASSTQKYIIMPKATIPVGEGKTFSFGGFQVQIVPDDFEILTTALKTIIGISVTLSFVNGLRKRYDEVMGVQQ